MYHQPLHLIRSVQGLLPSSPGVSPLLGCLAPVSRLGYPGSTPGRGISFPDCLLLYSRLGCCGSTPGRGISFPDCLLLYSRLGCCGSTPGRGISFPDCLLLFSRLGCPSNTPSRGIPFPDCLLFSKLGCPGSTPGRGIPFPDFLLLFNPLHCTQSPGTMTHLSHTHYVCEAPPDNPSSSLPPALLQPTLILFLFPSFLPSFLTALPQPTTSILLDNPLPDV